MNQFIFEAEQALLLLNVIPSIIVSYTYQNNLLKIRLKNIFTEET
jgi:hypothetical protein